MCHSGSGGPSVISVTAEEDGEFVKKDCLCVSLNLADVVSRIYFLCRKKLKTFLLRSAD